MNGARSPRRLSGWCGGGGVRDDSTALSSPPAPAAPVPAAPAADASERLREKAFEVSKSRARGYALEQLYGAEAVRMREPALDEAILRVLPYDPGQADGDWFRARIVVGCQLLTGELRLVRDVTSDGFIHFESECWLREAKRVLAYLRWESKGGSVPGDPWADYFAVVNEFHQALDDGRLALERDEFNPIRDYVVKMYLDEAGELDLASAAVERMVHAKGERIATVLGLPEAKARELAEDYATKYYQNIIPAVLKHDQEASGVIDNLMRGIDARYGDIPVNCFEAAVALHFPRA